MFLLNLLIGIVVNFIGYIPLGNVNLTVVQLTVNRGIRKAIYFILSFSFIEFFITYAAMYFADWLARKTNLTYWLNWIVILVFFVLAIVTWRNRRSEKEINYSSKDSIKYGLIIGLANPMQLPFWTIIGTYLIGNHWIVSGVWPLAVFSFGAALGAFLCLFSFAKFSAYLHERFAFSSKMINHGIAIFFFVFGIYHLVKQLLEIFG
jgi:threonine/homoserine/homoserine lactone efflux protein